MLKYAFIFIAMLMVSCSSHKQESTSLSADTESLTFGVEGGEQTFTVVSSGQMYLVPGDSWVTCRKGKKNGEKTVVTVTAEANNASGERQTQISVVAGEERIIIPVTQAGTQNGSGEAEGTMYVALSFDDGPNNETTPKVLDIIEEHGVTASFFVIGQYIDDSTAKQMSRAISLGCEIQNHSYTHSYMTHLTIDQVKDEIKRTDDLVEKYTSTRPTMFRPPYIDHNKAMHDALGHTFISGVSCMDWENSVSAQQRYDDLMSKVQDGDIILLHDFKGNDNTVEALKMIIPELKRRGFNIVTISELFAKKGISPKAHSGHIYSDTRN